MCLKKIVLLYKNDKVMFNNIIGTGVIRFISLLLSIVGVAGYTHYFSGNSVISGVWLTIVSILSWVINFDLGLGNGLRNRLAKYIAIDDKLSQKICISSAYILISIVSIIVLILGCVLSNFVNWSAILNCPPDLVHNDIFVHSIQITLTGLMLQFILKLIVSVLYALKKNIVASLSAVFTNLIVVAFSFLFHENDSEKGLIVMSIVFALASTLPLIILTIIVFGTRLKYAIPSLKCYNHKIGKDILALGGGFFLVQIFLLIINSTNEIIITHVSGPEAVVDYNMYFRLFSAVVSFFTVVINPIWSSVSESYYQGNVRNIDRQQKIVGIISLLFFCLVVVLAVSLQLWINLFYGKGVLSVEKEYVITFLIFTIALIASNSVACIENGINYLTPQIIGGFLSVILKFPLIYLINKFLNDWIVVVVSNGIIIFISFLIQMASLRFKLKKMRINIKDKEK